MRSKRPILRTTKEVEASLWDLPKNSKIRKATIQVLRELSDTDFERLRLSFISFFQPDREMLAATGRTDGGILIYLHPELEDFPLWKIRYLMAHEFAHIVLEHWKDKDPTTRATHEEAADKLVIDWGYKHDRFKFYTEHLRRKAQTPEQILQHKLEEIRTGAEKRNDRAILILGQDMETKIEWRLQTANCTERVWRDALSRFTDQSEE